MAARKPPVAPAPEYEPGGLRVGQPLAYPFRLGDRRIERLDLWPPSLDAIEMLRARDDIGPRDILAAMCEHDETTLGFLRWPDVEAALDAARPLLPADFLPQPEAPAPPEPAPVPAGDDRPAIRIPTEPTDLDDDEAELPSARPETLDDILGVSMEGIARG